MKFDYEKSEQLTQELINPFFFQYHCKKLNALLLDYAKKNQDQFPKKLEVTDDIPNGAILLTYSSLGAVPFQTEKISNNKKRIVLMDDYDDLF